MRKKILESEAPPSQGVRRQNWVDLRSIAAVEVTSEDPEYPIESAFDPEGGQGWRASRPGEQQIRIIFDHPLPVRRIQLLFREPESERTQEFTLRWASAVGGPTREIVRQQWSFSPAGATTELEDYTVNLDHVAVLEMRIQPDLLRTDVIASLSAWRVASRDDGER
jgi:hypothetical protein